MFTLTKNWIDSDLLALGVPNSDLAGAFTHEVEQIVIRCELSLLDNWSVRWDQRRIKPLDDARKETVDTILDESVQVDD